jgi:hypothetical protein
MVIRSRTPSDNERLPEGASAMLQQIVSAKPWLGRPIAFQAQLRVQNVIG